MANNTTLRWLLAFSAFLVFFMPVLLADELTLFENWLLIFVCWLVVIAISAYKTLRNNHSLRNNPPIEKDRA